jgi:hypothetical protein
MIGSLCAQEYLNSACGLSNQIFLCGRDGRFHACTFFSVVLWNKLATFRDRLAKGGYASAGSRDQINHTTVAIRACETRSIATVAGQPAWAQVRPGSTAPTLPPT